MMAITEEKVIKGSVGTEQSIKVTAMQQQGVKGNMKDVPSVDKTLTKDGYAADAKAVGDALATKAPDGYGLGGEGEYITCCHNVFKSGFYRFDDANGTPFDNGTMVVVGAGEESCNQTVVCESGAEKGTIAYRKHSRGGLKLKLWTGNSSTNAIDLDRGLGEYFDLGLKWHKVSSTSGTVTVYVDGVEKGSYNVSLGTKIQNGDAIALYYRYTNCGGTEKNRVSIYDMKLTVDSENAIDLNMNFNIIGNFRYIAEDDRLYYTINGQKNDLAYCVDKNSTQSKNIDLNKDLLFEQTLAIIDMPSGTSEMTGVRDGDGYFINIEDSTSILISAMIYNEGETAWEYVNPNFSTGVSYRTTDKHKGLAVYKRLASSGELQWSTDNQTWNTYAEQVGARPNTWMPTATDVGARPNTWTPTASQVGAVPTSRKVNGKVLSSDISLSATDVGARPDTWMPTADDVGAAPSGYGLGTGGVFNSSVDSVFNGGFYRWDTNNAQTPFGYATMLVIPRAKDTSAAQLAFGVASTSNGIIAYRTTTSTTPGEWKFVNPNMSVGTEYFTINRYKGKSTYKKLISFGTLPASGEKNMDTGIAFSGYEIIGCSVQLLHSSGEYVYFMTPNLIFGFYEKDGNWYATAESHSDLSAYKATVEIIYIKKG